MDLSPTDTQYTDTGQPSQLEGTYCYYVESFDAFDDGVDGGVGNADSNHVTVVYDVTHPTVALSGIASDTTVKGTLSLSATAADVGGSNLTSVTFGYRLGSSGGFTTIGTVNAPGPYAQSFNTVSLGLTGGVYEIQALATDGAGNTWTDVATNVTIDNTAPTVTLSGVADNAKVKGALVLSATAADSGGSSLVSVTFGYRLGSTGGFTTIGSAIAAPGPYSVSFDTVGLGLPNGTYEIQALAVDGVGNTNADVADERHD